MAPQKFITEGVWPYKLSGVYAFGRLLKKLLGALSHEDFAEAVGSTQTTVSQVISGTRSPPEDPSAWANFFRLKGDERDRFIRLANAQRARRQTRANPMRESLIDSLSLTRDIITLLNDKGFDVPQDLIQRLESLEEMWL